MSAAFAPNLPHVCTSSQSGKTTITRRLLEIEDDIELSISVTTRPRRPSEVDGVHYHFIDRPTFEAMVARDELLEHAEVYDHHYGTPRAAVERALPSWGTQAVVATLFGLAHGLAHALPIGVLSLVFGYLRQRHGSLLPSMLAHAAHNGITVTVVVCWPGTLDLLYAR